jgi:hypothetical protein
MWQKINDYFQRLIFVNVVFLLFVECVNQSFDAAISSLFCRHSSFFLSLFWSAVGDVLLIRTEKIFETSIGTSR